MRISIELCFLKCALWFYFSLKANTPKLKWFEDVKLDTKKPQIEFFFMLKKSFFVCVVIVTINRKSSKTNAFNERHHGYV